MKPLYCVETSGAIYPVTRRHIREGRRPQVHHCENPNTHTVIVVINFGLQFLDEFPRPFIFTVDFKITNILTSDMTPGQGIAIL